MIFSSPSSLRTCLFSSELHPKSSKKTSLLSIPLESHKNLPEVRKLPSEASPFHSQSVQSSKSPFAVIAHRLHQFSSMILHEYQPPSPPYPTAHTQGKDIHASHATVMSAENKDSRHKRI